MTILYDGECPMCRREMEFLRRRDRHHALGFTDIASPDFKPERYGITADQSMRMIHAVLPDGILIQGMDVFRAAYEAIGLGWLLAPTNWPGLRWVFDRLYLWFARNRLRIGRWLGRSCDDACGTPARQKRTAD